MDPKLIRKIKTTKPQHFNAGRSAKSNAPQECMRKCGHIFRFPAFENGMSPKRERAIERQRRAMKDAHMPMCPDFIKFHSLMDQLAVQENLDRSLMNMSLSPKKEDKIKKGESEEERKIRKEEERRLRKIQEKLKTGKSAEQGKPNEEKQNPPSSSETSPTVSIPRQVKEGTNLEE